MENHDIDFLAMTHLGINGVSKKTLQQALSFYEKKKSTTKSRGRPDNCIGQIFVFLFYYEAIQFDGLSENEITNKKLAKDAEQMRLITIENHYKNKTKDDIPSVLIQRIHESAVKGCRRNFRDIREKNPQIFNQIYSLIKNKRQK